eukprot:TRINITY_DN339_c1_g1_i1.p5 TRINITY_DN339_c1_g1~~TRINITY_DN339_c1_g1_i1.p5  ORF type:complete len:101 (-),score=32.44 TRINITY_DN339_c1_g1_i1:342-644(-)
MGACVTRRLVRGVGVWCCASTCLTTEDFRVNIFKLLAGLSAETSGGLLVCLPAAAAAAFCQALQQLDGEPAWIIGRVVASTDDVSGNTAVISSTPEFIDV